MLVKTILPITYTFTGNSRTASASSASTGTELTVKKSDTMTNFTFPPEVGKAYGKQGTYIKRARLLTPGADGLKPAINSLVAGSINLCVGDLTTADEFEPFTLNFTEFNKWEDMDAHFNVNANSNGKLYMGDATQVPVSTIYIDDFNIQTLYVGQAFNPILEMEVEYGSGC